MNLDDAKDLLRLYYQRSKNTLTLTEKQRAAVLSVLTRAYQDSDEVTISDVKKIVQDVVQQAPAALEGNEMPTEKAVNKFAQQEQAEQQQMLADVFRHKLLPGLANPFAYDNQGRVVGVDNTIAFNIMSDALAHWYEHFGNVPMTRGRVVELVAKLDLTGRWPHVLPSRVDENPPAPVKDDNQINNERRDKEKRMNAEGDSPIRGARTVVKPVATKEELVAAATDATAEAAAAATIAAMIKNHTGKSHGASAAESKLLTQLFEQSRAEGKSFQEVQGLIVAKKVEMLKWDAQKAIREAYADVAAKKGLSLDKTPRSSNLRFTKMTDVKQKTITLIHGGEQLANRGHPKLKSSEFQVTNLISTTRSTNVAQRSRPLEKKPQALRSKASDAATVGRKLSKVSNETVCSTAAN